MNENHSNGFIICAFLRPNCRVVVSVEHYRSNNVECPARWYTRYHRKRGKQPGGSMSLRYVIKVSKDHAQVTATWDVSVDISDTEMIANFALTVEGKAL